MTRCSGCELAVTAAAATATATTTAEATATTKAAAKAAAQAAAKAATAAATTTAGKKKKKKKKTKKKKKKKEISRITHRRRTPIGEEHEVICCNATYAHLNHTRSNAHMHACPAMDAARQEPALPHFHFTNTM